jgi:hypothetical protein
VAARGGRRQALTEPGEVRVVMLDGTRCSLRAALMMPPSSTTHLKI